MSEPTATLAEVLGEHKARITVGGQLHEFGEIGLDNLERFAQALSEGVELLALAEGGLGGEQLGQLISRAPSTVVALVRIGARVPDELMRRMTGSELRAAARAVFEVNRDFFVGVLEDLTALQPKRSATGSASSSASSAPATG